MSPAVAAFRQLHRTLPANPGALRPESRPRLAPIAQSGVASKAGQSSHLNSTTAQISAPTDTVGPSGSAGSTSTITRTAARGWEKFGEDTNSTAFDRAARRGRLRCPSRHHQRQRLRRPGSEGGRPTAVVVEVDDVVRRSISSHARSPRRRPPPLDRHGREPRPEPVSLVRAPARRGLATDRCSTSRTTAYRWAIPA